jgi:copper chaperone
MAEISLKIEGMSCQHCVASVKKALDSMDSITFSDVSVGAARVEFDDSRTSSDEICRAVQNAGYRVVN